MQVMAADNSFSWKDIRRIMPRVCSSAVIGTVVGALPGVGTTLAATLG
jgi:putative tricarboxylic transport membrane protein